MRKSFILLFAIILSGCVSKQAVRPVPRRGMPEPDVRILLLKNPQRFTVSSDIGTRVYTGGKKGIFAGEIVVYTRPLKIKVHGNMVVKDASFPVAFVPVGGAGIYLNGRPYRGYIKLIKNGGDILVVNFVKMEDYIKGVVPREMGRLSPELIEALKAQAVAARSYAFNLLNREKPYDLVNTETHQVYGSYDVSTPTTDSAVELTQGEVLMYRGKVADATYSSTRGGRTENNEEVWPGKPVPYLRSVYDGRFGEPFCRFSPHYEWQVIYNRDEFFNVVKKRIKQMFGKDVNRVKYIKVSGRTRSGRVKKVEIGTDRGKFTIEKDRIRSLFQYNGRSLKSILFTIRQKGNLIIIDGKGYGHGVGMCQYGAIGMARLGYNYKQILRHYYRGTRIVRLW